MAFFTEAEKHFKQDVLSYNTCKDIYRSSVMGKRVVEALVNFALSAEREISIQKAPPEAVERFNITAKQMKQKEAIKRTIYNARIYGTGALYVALHHIASDKDDFETKPNFNNVSDFEIFFNVLDPQNISGSVVDNNPLSSTFLQLIDIKVDNQIVPRKRIAVSHAVEPLYLDQRTSLIPYAPPSVFYNMIDLLKDYDASIEALDNLLYKAGAIIYKYPNQKFSGITLDAVKKSAEILEQKRNGAVISISEKCTVEDFPINNVNGLIESVNKLEDAITKALNDTPASLLFDKSLSNGFSEGDKDKETEISIIEAFRENKLAPLYTLTDYYVMLKAFDNDFINEMKDKYNDFKDKTNAQIFYEWVNSFKYEFGNLFPEPESATIENATKKLDNLLKLQQLGANTADIEAELNESGIFKQEIDLDGQQPDFDGDGIVGIDEPKKPDSEPPRASGGLSIDSDNPNNFRVDAEVPAGHEWKTLDNGEHVLINSETGEIVAGANYESWIEKYKKQKRREYFSDEPKWDDYGNEEDYKKAIHNHYFPQVEGTPDEIYKRLLDNINDAKSFKDMNFLMHGNKSGDFNRFIQEVNAIGGDRAKDIREKFDLKLAELRKASDKKSSQAGLDKPNKEPTKSNKEPEPKAEPEPIKSEPKPTTLSKEQYLKAKKDLKYTQELIDFHKSELEGYHPNDKMNREYKEREIAELESSNKARREAIAEYEKANPPVNAEKSKKEKKEKPKKIGKTYSITYDNETIEKLKSIGKNWKDRRIYFKELDNGYYDLENDKWVTDSPQLTEKALNMAAENETEKTARLEAEKREAERKAEEERRIKAEKDEAKRRVAEAVKNRMASPSFEADFFNAMNNAGMFNDFDIPQGSINKITGEFFTDDELSAWYNTYKYSSETEANLKDIVYSKVKKELDKVKEMYQPKRWADWLYEEKGIDNGYYNNYPEQWALIEAGILKPPKNFKMATKKMNNGDAWDKYGDEFNKYKSEFKAGAKEKMRAYVKEKLAGNGSGDIKVDSKIDINNIDNDINVLVDNLIRFVDKKDFDESKIKRDKDGRFAKKSGNKDADSDKSKDNDKKDSSNITEDERIRFIADIDDLYHGFDIGRTISDKKAEAIKKLIASGDIGDIEAIDKDIKYNNDIVNSDKDKYNKYIEYKKTNEYKKELKTAINQFGGFRKSTAEKLYPENLKAGELILDETGEIDENKIEKLNPIEKAINYFTEHFTNRNKKGFKQYQQQIKDLINKSIPKEISLYRYETEEDGNKRYNFKVGGNINMSVRSFCNSEDAFDSCRALQLRGRSPNECVIYKIDGKVKSLEIQSLSEYTNQKEHLVDGTFEITDIREATEIMPKIITIKQKGV